MRRGVKDVNNRSSGLLTPIFCLPSRFGIGDLGPEAYRFADLLSKNNQHYWQILPLNPTEIKHGNSPYHSSSAFAGNSILISPELIYRDGLLKKSELDEYLLPEKAIIDFARVYSLKQSLLEKVCVVFRESVRWQEEYEDFCQKHSFWLDDYVLFEVLREQYSDILWNKWPVGLRDRNENSLSEIRKKLCSELERQKIIQFLFFRQWEQFTGYCAAKNIKIIGDIPIYVTYQSSDVWAHQELFKLDKNKSQLSQAGVPPDYFSSTGQLWGNPIYKWSAHKKEDFSWWKRRITHNLTMFDLIRIDHFRGLVSYWEIPAKENTAIKGNWVSGGGEKFFQMLKDEFPDLPFIAEDLGVITNNVVEIINRLGIPGMRVLQFAFGKDFPKSIHLPHNHISNCVVFTGTHDNNTIRGWWKNELKLGQKGAIKRYTDKEVNISNIHWELIRLAQSSVAKLTIIPVQDILGLESEARINTPATVCGNWQWRLTNKQIFKLQEDALPELKALSQTFDRVSH